MTASLRFTRGPQRSVGGVASHQVRLDSRSAGSATLRAQSGTLSRPARSVLILAALCSIALADGACVRTVRTTNDSFYVINRKVSSNKRSAAPDPTAQLSNSAGTALTQARGGPHPKSSLSNVGILEDENSAISSLLGKVQTDPANASVHFQLGRVYHDYRLYDEALRYYQNALQLEQKPAYYEQTGRLWRDWGSLQQAADLAKKALELDPSFVEAWNTLGTVFDRQGTRDRAQEAYLRALSLNSDLDYVHNNLCFSYLQSGKFEQAIPHGERATYLNPAMVIAHNNLGLAYGMLGNLDRSLEEFKRSGDEAAARNNLGLILLKRGQIIESMEQFKLAARMRPYYKEAAANYRQARDLNSQRAREAKARLKSFDQETAMEAAPSAFGLVAIENVGFRHLGGAWELLSSQPVGIPPTSGSRH